MKDAYEYLNEVKMDFSLYEQNEEKRYNTMKKIITKKLAVIAACVAAISVTTAFATGLVGNIIKSVSTGHNIFHQVDGNAEFDVMDELKGKIFDENGNAIVTMSRNDIDNIYDKDGKKITPEMYADMIEKATGGIVAVSGRDEEHSVNYKYYDTFETAQKNTVFDIKIPEYLPKGYELTNIAAYTDSNGDTSGEYLNLLYTDSNGNEIKLFERIINENTAFEAGTDGMLDTLTIGDRTAVIMNNHSLHFETEDNVSVSINGNIDTYDLIKIAESIR